MELRIDPLTLSKRVSGWAFVGLMALGFAALYLLNYLLPLSGGSYTTRAWDWAELSLAAGALVVLAYTWRSLDLRTALLGAALALVSGLSRAFGNTSPLDGATEGIAVWLTFCAGAALFRRLKARAVTAFQPPPASILRSLGIGVLFALPLAALNNLFFYFQNGAPHFQSLFSSAFEALSPGIYEEAVYRYFVLAVCFFILKDAASRRWVTVAAVTLAVVPHSLLHLPDLFLDNPAMGLGMLAATSLLFGLPMALLQVRRNYESAAAFHWFIDFMRFLFGY